MRLSSFPLTLRISKSSKWSYLYKNIYFKWHGKIPTRSPYSTGGSYKIFQPYLHQSAPEGLLVIIMDIRNGFRLVSWVLFMIRRLLMNTAHAHQLYIGWTVLVPNCSKPLEWCPRPKWPLTELCAIALPRLAETCCWKTVPLTQVSFSCKVPAGVPTRREKWFHHIAEQGM